MDLNYTAEDVAFRKQVRTEVGVEKLKGNAAP